MLAISQVLLKYGLFQIGGVKVSGFQGAFFFTLAAARNPFVLSGTVLMASSYFLWMTILSWFKLSVAFPLTSLAFVFVAVLSYFLLNEKLLPLNYLGIVLITGGIFLLLYKQ
jgi:drug/metabolite transporter (DMT)-like permease